MKLSVGPLALEDTWKDIVRIKKDYRKDLNKKHIPRGAICRITVGDRSKWVIVHGRESNDEVIQMDLNVRLALGVETNNIYDFTIERLSWLKSLWFPWKASDPIYRLPAQLSIVSACWGFSSVLCRCIRRSPSKHLSINPVNFGGSNPRSIRDKHPNETRTPHLA